VKLVHAADLHLDSPLWGLSQQAHAPLTRVRTATRKALANLVDLCIEERAGLLVIAGDLYDGDWRDYGTGLYFADQMVRLREVGVRVALIRGNHDAASQITKHLRLPDNVRELSVRHAETVCYEDLGLAVHGQSFAMRAVTENLCASYPERVPGLLNVGLLHTALNGRRGHEAYAPCALDDLRSKGYDYWALGHVHAREVVARDPWIVFPGNLQARHARETGDKGAMVVEYDAGGVVSVAPRAVDEVRYAPCRLDLSDVTSFDEALDRLRPAFEQALRDADGRALGVRVIVHGATPLHTRLAADRAFLENARALALEIGSDELWVEKLMLETTAAVSGSDAADRSALCELLDAVGRVAGEPEALAELAGELREFRGKLPPELREGEDGMRVEDPAFLAQQLMAARELLALRLFGEGEGDT
jgi:DNA repair exonuclease SbcCD nuclease subunit